MKISFLSRFSKDLDAITDPTVKADIKATIEQVKTAPNQKAILNLKKLQGYKTAYRIGVFRRTAAFRKVSLDSLQRVNKAMDITQTGHYQ